MQIANKVAVITGGASGLGRATAERFHAAGAKVAIFDLNDEAGEALVKSLGERAIYRKINVSSEVEVREALAAVVTAFGGVHICCNYAGIGGSQRILGKDGVFPLDKFRGVIDVNLIGTFNVMRLAAEQMARNEPEADGLRGVVINTASVAGYEGQIGQIAYSASKAGIIGMTIVAARDLSAVGIRVNTIVPGIIDTPLLGKAPQNVRDALGQQVLFPKRLGRPEEIAATAAYIVETDYINGECIRLDGGIRMPPK